MQLSGLYEGVSLDRQSVSHSGTLPERITLYRRPIIAEWQSTRVSLEQLVAPHRDPRGRPSFRLFRRRHARARGQRRVTPLLRFEGVTLRRGGRMLFEQLDLELAPGEALQVAGPNGSGKSSLIRACRRPAPRRARHASSARRCASPTTISRSTASCRCGARLRFWGEPRRRGARSARPGGPCRGPGAPAVLGPGEARDPGPRRRLAAPRCGFSTSRSTASTPTGPSGLIALVDAHLATGGAVLAASHQPLPGEWRRLELGRR